jgi:hypothetical protein
MVPPPTPLVLEFAEHIFSIGPVTIELRQGVHFIGQIRDQFRIFIAFGLAIAFYKKPVPAAWLHQTAAHPQ